jgi:D-xylose transport system substrate-binding protein
VSAAQELGAEVNVQNANGDIDEQAAQIDYFIKKKMDVIVVVMVASDEDTGEFYNAVERAKKAGIPVVAYDRLILNADVDLYISFDNVEVGRLMAEHMREHLVGTGNVLQICGPLSDYNVPQVMSGFEEVLKGSSMEITETAYAEGWYAETGFSVTGNYLAAHKAPDGIMCGNDSIAGQAIRALSEQRLTGSVCVVGQDADLDACQRIVEGTQCMTVYKPVEKLARRAAELSVALAEGEAFSVEETINDGIYQVPYERLEPIAVTKENMDDVITGKYHEESDIYLNVRK